MAVFIDARVPVRTGRVEEAGTEVALLIEGGVAVPAGVAVARIAAIPAQHAPGCACCVPRGPIAEALARLFIARARGEVPFFREVVAVLDDTSLAGLHQALETDPLLAGRYRLA